MFEKSLEEKLKGIFGVKKVDFALPSESQEQECLFVSVEDPKFRFKDGYVVCRVTGSCSFFANSDKLPFGYFSACIENADNNLTKDMWFGELEGNERIYRNIVQRTFSFVYFFRSQHDPNIGTLDELDIIRGT